MTLPWYVNSRLVCKLEWQHHCSQDTLVKLLFPFHFIGLKGILLILISPSLFFLGCHFGLVWFFCSFVCLFFIVFHWLEQLFAQGTWFQELYEGFICVLTGTSGLKNWPYKGSFLSFWNLGSSLRFKLQKPSETYCLRKENLLSRADTQNEGTRVGQPAADLQEGLGPSGGSAATGTRGSGLCLSPGRRKESCRTSACGVTTLRGSS